MRAKEFLSTYYGTYFVSLLGMCSMLFLTGVFARLWSYSEFAEFSKLLRYLGLLSSISSFSLGFSIIYYEAKEKTWQKIFPTAFYAVSASSLIIGFFYTSFTSVELHVVLWLLSSALFHVFISATRRDSPLIANIVTIFIKILILNLIVILCAINSLDKYAYFSGYGGAVIFTLLAVAIMQGYSINPISISLKTGRMLYTHAFSRMLDNSVRALMHFVPVVMADIKIAGDAAGEVAIVLVLSKAIESSLQPVVMQIHSNRVGGSSLASSNSVFVLLRIGVAGAALVTLGLFFFGELIVSQWLSNEYNGLIKYMYFTIWCTPCIIVLQWIRANLESSRDHSPLLKYNSFVLLGAAVASYSFASTIETLMTIYFIGFLVRLFLGVSVLKSSEKSVQECAEL